MNLNTGLAGLGIVSVLVVVAALLAQTQNDRDLASYKERADVAELQAEDQKLELERERTRHAHELSQADGKIAALQASVRQRQQGLRRATLIPKAVPRTPV